MTTLIFLFYRRALFAKRTILFAAIPLVFALMAPFAGRLTNQFVYFEQNLCFLMLMFPGVLLPLFFACRSFQEELESRTIGYLFTRPRPRGEFLVAKYLASALASISIMAPAAWLMAALLPGPMTSEVRGDAMKLIWVLVAEAFVYSAFFLWMGIALKRPVLLGLILSMAWETAASWLPGGFRSFTVMYYLRAQLLDSFNIDQFLDTKVDWENPSAWVCWLTLAVITVVTLGIAHILIRRKEYS